MARERNDIVVFRETVGKTLPDHPRLSGDGGYRGSDRIRTPRRGPDGRIIKDRNYRRFRQRRAVAEHTIARLKDHQILRQCRRRGDGINHAVAGIAGLHPGSNQAARPTGELILTALSDLRMRSGTATSPPVVLVSEGIQAQLLDILDVDPTRPRWLDTRFPMCERHS